MESLPIDMESPRGTLVIALGESLFRERMGETPDGKIIANYVTRYFIHGRNFLKRWEVAKII